MNFLLTEGEINALNDEIEASPEFQELPDGSVTLYVGRKHCQAQLAKALWGIDGLKAKETCHHTFDNRGVEECILIKAADWRNLMELSKNASLRR